MAVVFDCYKLRKRFREWRYFSPFLFLKNVFFSGPILVSKEWPVSLRMFFNPVKYCSALTLIIHSYELMLLSIILC